MNFRRSLPKNRVLPLALLLWALPSAAYAFDDSIISQALWWLLAIAVGFGAALWGLVKLVSTLIGTLQKGEAPETAAAGKPQRGLAVRVLLLSFPLQLVWLWTAYPAARMARLAVPYGHYSYVLVTCAFTSIPTIMLVLWLWRTRRPRMALGLGLSGGLVVGGLAALMEMQPHQPAGAVAVMPNVVGPDQLPDKVYTYVESMPAFPGGPDSLQAFVRRNLRYPSLLRADQRSGTVHLQYVVDPAGNVAQVQLTESLGPVFDEEAVRLVRSLPPFAPGRQNNEPVAVLKQIDIPFQPPGHFQ